MKNTDKAKSKRRRCASRTTLSELKQLHKEIKDYLEGLRAQIDQLSDDIDECCQSISGKMEEGIQAYKEKSK